MRKRDQFFMVCKVRSIRSAYLELFDQCQVVYRLSRVVENDSEVVEDAREHRKKRTEPIQRTGEHELLEIVLEAKQIK